MGASCICARRICTETILWVSTRSNVTEFVTDFLVKDVMIALSSPILLHTCIRHFTWLGETSRLREVMVTKSVMDRRFVTKRKGDGH